MKGYLFNSLLVAAGSAAGLIAGNTVRENVKSGVFAVLGLVTAFIGFRMSMNGNDVIPIVFCLVLGMCFGSVLRIEDRLNNGLKALNHSWFSGQFDTEGFLIASALFCVGSMTLIGSLKDGLYNDDALIKTKSVMDCFASFLLAARYGKSVIFSAVTVFAVQGSLTVFSSYLMFLTPQGMMNNIDGVGGIIVLAIGFNLLELKKIKTVDMLPALVFIVVYGLS